MDDETDILNRLMDRAKSGDEQAISELMEMYRASPHDNLAQPFKRIANWSGDRSAVDLLEKCAIRHSDWNPLRLALSSQLPETSSP